MGMGGHGAPFSLTPLPVQGLLDVYGRRFWWFGSVPTSSEVRLPAVFLGMEALLLDAHEVAPSREKLEMVTAGTNPGVSFQLGMCTQNWKLMCWPRLPELPDEARGRNSTRTCRWCPMAPSLGDCSSLPGPGGGSSRLTVLK